MHYYLILFLKYIVKFWYPYNGAKADQVLVTKHQQHDFLLLSGKNTLPNKKFHEELWNTFWFTKWLVEQIVIWRQTQTGV